MGYPFALLMDPPAPAYPEYAALMGEARRTVPPFVDPADLYPARGVVQRRGDDWCSAVLGKPVDMFGYQRWSHLEHQFVILADAAGIEPPLPDWIVQAREESARHREAQEERKRQLLARDEARWREALGKATVGLEVHAGSRPRARDGYGMYLGHAVPVVDVYSGTRRVRTHPNGRALCESETRSSPLQLSGKTDGPATCVRCLEWVPQVRPERKDIGAA